MPRTNIRTICQNPYATAALLALLAIGFAILRIYSGHSLDGDSFQYIAQAKAIVEGKVAEQIANNTFIIENSQSAMGPKIYPWGLPILLAPIYKVFGYDVAMLKMVGVLSYGLFVGLFYLFCARFLTRGYALGATLAFALNPMLLSFAANNVLSDMPFMLFSFIAIVSLLALFGTRSNALVLGLIGGGQC